MSSAGITARAGQRLRIMLAGTLLAVSLLLIAVNPHDATVGLLGLAVIWISAIPIFVQIDHRARDAAPLLAAAGVYYIVFFGLPIFMERLAYHVGESVVLYSHVLVGPLQPSMLLLVSGGILAMWAGYYHRGVLPSRLLPPLRLPRPSKAAVLSLLYGVLLVAGTAYRLSPAAHSIPSLGQLLEPAPYLALGGFYLQWRAGQLTRGWALAILVIMLPIEIYLRGRYLLTTSLLFLAMFFAFLLWREGRRKLIYAILAGVIVLGLFYSALAPIKNSAKTVTARLSNLGSVFTDMRETPHDSIYIPARGWTVTYDRRISPLVHRIGQIYLFQAVYERTPQQIPYWNGETYKPLLTSVIPRFLYPGKPREIAGGEFGKRYGLIRSDTRATSVNIPWIIELMANFGPLGVVAGMAVFGLLIGILNRVLNARAMGDTEFVIGLSLLFRLAYPESNFSVMTGSLPLQILAYFLYFRIGTPVLDNLLGRRQAADG